MRRGVEWPLNVLKGKSSRQVIGTANITSPGFIDLSTSGPITGRLHRVQKLLRNLREYSYEDPKEFVVDQANTDLLVGSSNRFWFFGDQLWMSPFDSTDEDVDIRYSALPALYTGLANATTVVWPDGFEGAGVFETAFRLTGDEGMKITANASWSRLKSYVKRRYPGPMVIPGFGDHRDFGSSD